MRDAWRNYLGKNGLFHLGLAGHCAVLGLALHFLFAPGFAKLHRLNGDLARLSANVYQKSWLDSTQVRLRRQAEADAIRLQRAKARLLPERPMQQSLDSLRLSASQAGVEILETQVSASQTDSIKTTLLKLHARGDFAALWRFHKTLEGGQPWWFLNEMVVRPLSENSPQLDVMMHWMALGRKDAKP